MLTIPSEKTIIEGDLSCAICGYNLRTLRPKGLCPECGTPICRTMLGLELNERWLWKVNLGIELMWWAVLFGFAPLLILPMVPLVHALLFADSCGLPFVAFWTSLTSAVMGVAFGLISLKEPPDDPMLATPQSGRIWGLRWLVLLFGMALLCAGIYRLYDQFALYALLGFGRADRLTWLGVVYCFVTMWLFLFFLRVPIQHTPDSILNGQIKLALWVLPFIFAAYVAFLPIAFTCVDSLLAAIYLLWFGYLVRQARQTF